MLVPNHPRAVLFLDYFLNTGCSRLCEAVQLEPRLQREKQSITDSLNTCKTGRKLVASGVLNPAGSGTKYTPPPPEPGDLHQDFGTSFEDQCKRRTRATKLTVRNARKRELKLNKARQSVLCNNARKLKRLQAHKEPHCARARPGAGRRAEGDNELYTQVKN